ncbi:MAG: hypothetical protein ACQET3_08775 [Promethearchaeati archaeon]
MTFLIDPPLLVGLAMLSQYLGSKITSGNSRKIGQLLALFSLCTIMFTSSSLYLNMWYMDWFWCPFQPLVASGKDLMINSGIFSFESVNTAGLIDALAAFQIILYPVWIYLGYRIYYWLFPSSKGS